MGNRGASGNEFGAAFPGGPLSRLDSPGGLCNRWPDLPCEAARLTDCATFSGLLVPDRPRRCLARPPAVAMRNESRNARPGIPPGNGLAHLAFLRRIQQSRESVAHL